MTPRKKIAVLGGGAGSLSTVFALTSQPGWQDRYDITVYQMGWRLGGKGASGRDRQVADRIYEHGFHMWMGFYANAFSVMRECYDERARLLTDPGAFRTWSDAFKPATRFVFTEHIGDGWHHWPIDYPVYPGDPSDPVEHIPAWDYVLMVLHLLRDHLKASPHAGGAPLPAAEEHHSLWRRIAERIVHDVEGLLLAGALVALEAVVKLAGLVREAAGDHGLLADAIAAARAHIWKHLADAIERDDAARRLWIVMDLGLTIVRGILVDRVLSRGFDAIDDIEFRDWLRSHGATDLAVMSAPVAALYSANFSYVGGDYSKPNFAAGVALQSYLRLFLASRGAFSWVMQSGMGDVVFSPLYQVLKARGVTFKFFHRVTALRYDAAGNAVGAIEMEEQVRLTGDYDPLYRVQGVDAWPSEPFCDQIEHGDELEQAIRDGRIDLESSWSRPWKDARPVTLTRGRDYDLIVLGISLGALRTLCHELVDAKPEWRGMVDHVVTVPTQSQQVWFKPTLGALGWTEGPSCVEGFPSPLGQWLDASHALPFERWPADQRPGTLVYFCDAFADAPNPDGDPDFPARRLEVAWQGTRQWFEKNTAAVWPAAVVPGTTALDGATLVDLANGPADTRLRAQFCRVNVEPSERFVLSVAGSTRYRMTADGSGVDGLYLTGDWVRNGFNVGCVESTVMSGLQCARAISGAPQTIAHEHFLRDV